MARNPLLAAPPYPVEQALKRLGANLRIARIRRRLTVQEVAEKIGTGSRAVSDAERGKPSTSVATYAALLWAFGLLGGLEALADPTRDSEGQALALSREPSRVRPTGGLDNDF
jgi:transcriptional regulator with XRE-family HTH domain